MWASLDEADARFQAETLATYDFRVRDRWDNGEFLTGATVDLYERGKVVHTETFVASSEDAPLGGFSAYGNGRDNHALTQALSYAHSWVESRETTLEERLAPVGPEWEREMAEAR
jgi:hypothetical protein